MTIITTSFASITGEYGTWTAPASASMMKPCMVATVAPPAHLPTMIAPRRTGATSISRRNPNSRSQTIDTAEKIAVNRIVMAITPGNMNVRKSKCPEVLTTVPRPVPSTKRNRTGWASDVRIRIRFREKRMISRRHTTFAARRSSSQVAPSWRSMTGAN